MQQKPQRRTILLIEDERPLVRIIETKLEKAGFDVVSARTIDQGLGYLEDIQTIDAVWLDHYLLGAKNWTRFHCKAQSTRQQMDCRPYFRCFEHCERRKPAVIHPSWCE